MLRHSCQLLNSLDGAAGNNFAYHVLTLSQSKVLVDVNLSECYFPPHQP